MGRWATALVHDTVEISDAKRRKVKVLSESLEIWMYRRKRDYSETMALALAISSV